jgi:hypothetical protein
MQPNDEGKILGAADKEEKREEVIELPDDGEYGGIIEDRIEETRSGGGDTGKTDAGKRRIAWRLRRIYMPEGMFIVITFLIIIRATRRSSCYSIGSFSLSRSCNFAVILASQAGPLEKFHWRTAAWRYVRTSSAGECLLPLP